MKHDIKPPKAKLSDLKGKLPAELTPAELAALITEIARLVGLLDKDGKLT
jgi:hypothetical protein